MHFIEKTIILSCIIVTFISKIDTVINNKRIDRLQLLKIPSINKVTLTQKGYIQFLRYVAEVPSLKDYTFCIWVKSNNLTHNHPLLSYSKHEKDRLIRVWIGAAGLSLNLEILNVKIFELPIMFVEHRWYHICQSWSSNYAVAQVFLNGKLLYSGRKSELNGVKIDGGGDIVVGQEYTDFDKGLDDGIEGDIFGFNLVLASTINRYQSGDLIKSTNFLESSQFDDFDETPLGLKLVQLGYNSCYVGRGAPISGRYVLISWTRTPVRVFGGAVLKDVPPFCVQPHNKPLII